MGVAALHPFGAVRRPDDECRTPSWGKIDAGDGESHSSAGQVMTFQYIIGKSFGAPLASVTHVILRDGVSVCQAFMPRLRSRCKITGFATGNFGQVCMKGLAADVESLLKVRLVFVPGPPFHACCILPVSYARTS